MKRSSAHQIRSWQARTLIAQTVARLILEHGMTDWASAKRKALRQLGLDERQELPSNDEIELALREHTSLYGGTEQAASLLAQRQEALRWMTRLAAFQPILTGGVAAGWASDHSAIRLELMADDTKAVELFLVNAGLTYRVTPPRSFDSGDVALSMDTSHGTVVLTIMAQQRRRERPRRDDETRLGLHELSSLLQNQVTL